MIQLNYLQVKFLGRTDHLKFETEQQSQLKLHNHPISVPYRVSCTPLD